MEKKINILGTEYTVIMGVPVEQDSALANRFGYCFPIAKKIVIADLNSIDSWKEEAEECKSAMTKQTVRHEVIHAFLAESGLWGSSNNVEAWAMNEEMIDWLAIQYPKMKQVFIALECD